MKLGEKKFHVNWTKNVDDLSMANFLHVSFLFPQTLIQQTISANNFNSINIFPFFKTLFSHKSLKTRLFAVSSSF